MDKELQQLTDETLAALNFHKLTLDQKRAFFTGFHTATLIARSGHEAGVSLYQVVASLSSLTMSINERIEKEMLDNQTKVS
jgi:hypothetical protein